MFVQRLHWQCTFCTNVPHSKKKPEVPKHPVCFKPSIMPVLGTLGCVLLILGYLIKFKNKIQLVAGVYKNKDKIKDIKGFASLVGGNGVGDAH